MVAPPATLAAIIMVMVSGYVLNLSGRKLLAGYSTGIATIRDAANDKRTSKIAYYWNMSILLFSVFLSTAMLFISAAWLYNLIFP